MSGTSRPTDHLWLQFTKMSNYRNAGPPVIVRGDGPYVYDENGKQYLDGLAGLFVNQLGHGRTELAEAAARQASALAYFPIWSHAHPTAIELAARLAGLAPGDLDRIFFTSSGSEAVESAWKLAKQYFTLTRKPAKYKVISRSLAYHGTTHGALSITGLPGIKEDFEPLVPAVTHVPNTNFYRSSEAFADDPQGREAFGRWAADQIAYAIDIEGADTVAAVFVEPVQNAGGCLTAPPSYFSRVREICDANDVLMVSDEVICAFGRLGHYFGCERYQYVPDIITCAKGLTSGYAPMGAMIASNRLMEPFLHADALFAHGSTFAGHPVAAAVALANLSIFDTEQINQTVREREGDFESTLCKLKDIPVVGDVRGDGFFYAIEVVKDQSTKQRLDAETLKGLAGGALAGALFDAGLYCRVDNRGDLVIQLAPPLICDQEHFDEMEQKLRGVLSTIAAA